MPETPTNSEDNERLDTTSRIIQTLNDHLRTTFSGGRVVTTQGIQALPEATVAKAFKAVRDYDNFNEDNDPYKTHEFGMFEIDGERMMFKVDCYDQNLEYGSPNPADTRVTTRVLTILLASEY